MVKLKVHQYVDLLTGKTRWGIKAKPVGASKYYKFIAQFQEFETEESAKASLKGLKKNVANGYTLSIKLPDDQIELVVLEEPVTKNFAFTHKGKKYWYSRACATATFIYGMRDGELVVLVNKRGPGTPDHQGKWNAPCGYLDHNESLKTCAAREVFEETGVRIDPAKLIQIYTQSEEFNGKQNVTQRFIYFLDGEIPEFSTENSEDGEISAIDMISRDDVLLLNNKDGFAFNHDALILKYAEIADVYFEIKNSVIDMDKYNAELSILPVCDGKYHIWIDKRNSYFSNEIGEVLGTISTEAYFDLSTGTEYLKAHVLEYKEIEFVFECVK